MKEKILEAYERLKNAAKGAEAAYKANPADKIGCVTLIGKNITFNDSDAFIQAVNLADVFEVYPKTDGTIQMDFTFYNRNQED